LCLVMAGPHDRAALVAFGHPTADCKLLTPELPEAEAMRATHSPHAIQQTIARVWVPKEWSPFLPSRLGCFCDIGRSRELEVRNLGTSHSQTTNSSEPNDLRGSKYGNAQ